MPFLTKNAYYKQVLDNILEALEVKEEMRRAGERL